MFHSFPKTSHKDARPKTSMNERDQERYISRQRMGEIFTPGDWIKGKLKMAHF